MLYKRVLDKGDRVQITKGCVAGNEGRIIGAGMTEGYYWVQCGNMELYLGRAALVQIINSPDWVSMLRDR
jgi:hypothetical protein